MVNYIEVHAKTYEPGEKKVIINAIGKFICLLLIMNAIFTSIFTF